MPLRISSSTQERKISYRARMPGRPMNLLPPLCVLAPTCVYVCVGVCSAANKYALLNVGSIHECQVNGFGDVACCEHKHILSVPVVRC